MPEALTEKQNKVLKFIEKFMAENKKPPTVREIGKAMRVRSTNAVADVLKVLEKKKYVRKTSGSRSLEIIYEDSSSKFGFGSPSSDRMTLVSVAGTPNQKSPNAMLSSPRGNLYLDKNLSGGKDCFLAVVEDDGMDKGGIYKGDLVLVERMATLDDLKLGESKKLVAAVVADELIIRHATLVNGRLHLAAANASYSEHLFKLTDKDFHVFGEVKLVMRKV
jgi:repressor LexA